MALDQALMNDAAWQNDQDHFEMFMHMLRAQMTYIVGYGTPEVLPVPEEGSPIHDELAHELGVLT